MKNFYEDLSRDLTYEEIETFKRQPIVQELGEKYRKITTLLVSEKVNSPLSQDTTKFGGIPSFFETDRGFKEYPTCDKCNSPLYFVLQIFKRDVRTFYFPGDNDLFQLFRCPNYDCPAYCTSDHYDHKMFCFFTRAWGAQRQLQPATPLVLDKDHQIQECLITPVEADDYPGRNGFHLYEKLLDVHHNLVGVLYIDLYDSIRNTKFNGYPSYTQWHTDPIKCSCGREKEFFFQFSSNNDTHFKVDTIAPHGIMMGDNGNIYFFICKYCGPDTIESRWDCE